METVISKEAVAVLRSGLVYEPILSNSSTVTTRQILNFNSKEWYIYVDVCDGTT